MKIFQLKLLVFFLFAACMFIACEKDIPLSDLDAPSSESSAQLTQTGDLTPTSGNDNAHICATDSESILLQKRYPQYYDENHPAKLEMEKIYANSATAASQKNGQVYTIPVIFHVLWDTDNGVTYGDIQASQIDRAMEMLNEDFNKLNNQSDVPGTFASIAADADLEFVLAEKDPSGTCLNEPGIERINTNYVFDGSQGSYGDYIKTTWHWPAHKYLNVYLVDYISGASGYAILPDVAAQYPPQYDGIVLDYGYLGDQGEASGTSYPHTLTHEVGHWAGLNHVWGTGAVGSSSNCNADDGISDTPNTVGNYNYNHPSNCSLSNTSCGSADNIHNFMEYSCQLMFTNGQVGAMRSVLESSIADRNNLWTAANLSDVMGCSGSGNNSCSTPSTSEITFTGHTTVIHLYTNPYYGITHQFRYRLSGTSTWTTFSQTTSHYNTISGTQACQTYEVQLRQKCGSTWSSWSATKSVTSACCPKPVPSEITYTEHSSLIWIYAFPYQGDTHQFRYRLSTSSSWTTLSATTSHYNKISNKQSCATYKVQLRQKCGSTWSGWSNVKNINTGC